MTPTPSTGGTPGPHTGTPRTRSHHASPGPGINLTDGHDDDGWAVPPPVILDDSSRVQLYKDGQALHAAYTAIEHARHRICLEVYIFSHDDTGQRFAELLARKAREGVEVYLIYDDFGSLATPRKTFRDLKRAGVRIRSIHPVRPWECTFSWRPLNRDHRKLLIIDGHLGGLGGLNIGTEYAGSWLLHPTRLIKGSRRNLQPHDFWRDNAIGIVGPSARILQIAFNRTWSYASRAGRIRRAMTLHPLSPTADPRSYTVPREGNHFSLLATVPTLDSPLRPALHRLFASARHSICLTMAYFAPDDDLIAALCRAARRGVRVRLMLPGRCDVPLLIVAARSFYETLMSAGVQIFERQSVVLHAKTMVVDEHLSVIGSTNLDYRSIEYNLELSAIITSREFGKQMTALFENDILYAKRISPTTWKRRAWADRMKQWAVSRARYML